MNINKLTNKGIKRGLLISIFSLSSFLSSAQTDTTGGGSSPIGGDPYPAPCEYPNVTFSPEIGIGSLTRIVIGGNSSNDGAINFNAFQSPSTYGQSYATNMPSGPYVGGVGISNSSAQIFLDNNKSLFQFRVGRADCNQPLLWNNALNIDLQGNVGIGTEETFGYKLAVNGTFSCKEIEMKPTTLWPDYVFDSTFVDTLKSITELKNSLLTNKHLENMPSAAEVSKTGLKQMEFNAKLLENIEMLYLYIIQLSEQNSDLKEEVRKLKTAQTPTDSINQNSNSHEE